jgi:hypothetical protein
MEDGAQKKTCGIVRPIAAMEGYTAEHWVEVHNIITEAVKEAGYKARLVSESDAAGIIVGSIINNIYNDDIVICDVSGRNPNVMFELGMRVAFEKPVIIVVDDATPFSFDISHIKHIIYPKTLRFYNVIEFKTRISAAIPATIEASTASNGRSGYLQQFGPIKITELSERQISGVDIASSLEDIKRSLRIMEDVRLTSQVTANTLSYKKGIFSVAGVKEEYKLDLVKGISAIKGVINAEITSDRGLMLIEYSMSDPHIFNSINSIIIHFRDGGQKIDGELEKK